MIFPPELIEVIIGYLEFNDLYLVLLCMNKIIAYYVVRKIWSDFFVNFHANSLLDLDLKNIAHILFGTLSDKSKYIIVKNLNVNIETLKIKPTYDYLKFIRCVDSTFILKICDTFICDYNLFTVSNELFAKVISESLQVEKLTIDLVGLNDQLQRTILEVVRQKRLKIVRVCSFLDYKFEDMVFKSNRELICEIISKCNVDMLWIEESLNIPTNKNITKLIVNNRSKNIIQYFEYLEQLTLDDVELDEKVISGLKVPKLIVYTKKDLKQFYNMIMKNSNINRFNIERIVEYNIVKSYVIFKTTKEIFDRLLEFKHILIFSINCYDSFVKIILNNSDIVRAKLNSMKIKYEFR